LSLLHCVETEGTVAQLSPDDHWSLWTLNAKTEAGPMLEYNYNRAKL
jgi:hypothetical protein